MAFVTHEADRVVGEGTVATAELGHLGTWLFRKHIFSVASAGAMVSVASIGEREVVRRAKNEVKSQKIMVGWDMK